MRSFLTKILISLFMFASTGCHSDKELSTVYNNYKFDPRVMEKTSLYDSLASSILKYFPLFRKKIKEEDSYKAYRYMPDSYEPGVFRIMPEGVGPDVSRFYNLIGKDLIYGFDLFRDSTIKMFIRNNEPPGHVSTDENLSYYPSGKIQRREFPVRDTILSSRLLYWARFSQPRLF